MGYGSWVRWSFRGNDELRIGRPQMLIKAGGLIYLMVRMTAFGIAEMWVLVPLQAKYTTMPLCEYTLRIMENEYFPYRSPQSTESQLIALAAVEMRYYDHSRDYMRHVHH